MKHPPFKAIVLIPSLSRETVSDGQFKWGTCLLKSSGGVQRSAKYGWKSYVSGKAISRLYSERDIANCWETRT